MMQNKNSQGAIEFVVIFAAVLFFFISFFGAVKINTDRKNLEKERMILQNIALDVQHEINLAAESSEGYYREFKIPENILGRDYQINITNNRIYASIGQFGVSYRVFEVNGVIKKGLNNITNKNGAIFIN